MDLDGADRGPELCWAGRMNPTSVGPACVRWDPLSPARDNLSPRLTVPQAEQPRPAHRAGVLAQGPGPAAQTHCGQDPQGGTERAVAPRGLGGLGAELSLLADGEGGLWKRAACCRK